jgi:DNA-binding XRE family transcriptional regulator
MNTKQKTAYIVDKNWFTEHLHALKKSQSKLADDIGVHKSSLNLMLKGTRKPTLDNVRMIAEIFKVSSQEVMRRFGISVTEDVRVLKIKGYIGDKSRVNMFDRTDLDVVEAPADVPLHSYCLQVRQPGTAHDGWILFVSSERTTADVLVDRPAIAELGDGTQISCVIRRGYKAGTANLYPLHSADEPLENQNTNWASPILWMRPN